MRRVDLNMKEQEIYEIIKKLVDTKGNKNTAAIKLGYTKRYINKLIIKYLKEGKAGFIHKNSGRKPKAAFSYDLKKKIIKLYETKYYNFNWTHFLEALNEVEMIKITYTPLRHILTDAGFISPLCNKETRKKKRKELEEKKELSNIDKITIIESNLYSKDKAHPRMPRAKFFGELIQMDASEIVWFNNEKSTLHLAVDDATGTVVGAYFDRFETLNGYYNVLKQILENYGIPCKFLTDNRTVFTYKSDPNPTDDKDTYTQFSYACKTLGIDINTSSIPQKKGRIERFNQTFQNRLPQEMRIANIQTIEQANEFLAKYLIKFNAKFALHGKHISSAFESQPSPEQINQILAIYSRRKFDHGSSIKYKNKYYEVMDSNGQIIPFKAGTEGLVIQSFDKSLYIAINEKIYALIEVPEHKETSEELEIPFKTNNNTNASKAHKPPLSHPWKQASYLQYQAKIKHRLM